MGVDGVHTLLPVTAGPCSVQGGLGTSAQQCQGGWAPAGKVLSSPGSFRPLQSQEGVLGSDATWLSFADEMNDQQNTLSYVLINPPPDTRLEPNDIV